jgi:hypothetical protein
MKNTNWKYACLPLAAILLAIAIGKPRHASATGSVDTVPRNPFPKIERPAVFAAGKEAWKSFLVSNVNGDVPVKKGAPAGRYEAYVRFVIDTAGHIDTVMVMKDPGYGMAEELKRVVLLSSGRWMPAILEGGKKSRSMQAQPFTFQVTQK